MEKRTEESNETDAEPGDDEKVVGLNELLANDVPDWVRLLGPVAGRENVAIELSFVCCRCRDAETAGVVDSAGGERSCSTVLVFGGLAFLACQYWLDRSAILGSVKSSARKKTRINLLES